MIEIIPAIDIIDGKCVRLTQGDYDQKKVYSENPLTVAKMFEDSGLKRLHLVDLDGAKSNHVVNARTLDRIVSKTNLIVDFGGGIKSDNDINLVFNCGAAQVTIGSIAVTNPEMFIRWIQKFGPEKVILGADVKDKRIAIDGWNSVSENNLIEFLKFYVEKGVKYIICTDISKDGMLQGSSLNLYEELAVSFPNTKIIASGGITNISEIEILDSKGIFGAIIGKAIYEGNIRLNDLKKFL
jgi:phosphoribosylformimino-5-aminoimidazole carboxamide ribotide isomerase